MKRTRQASWTTGALLGTAVAAVLLGAGFASAAPPPGKGGGGGGGGDAGSATGTVYYYYTPDLIAMDADGANKTILGLPIGDAIPSVAKHDGKRWFLHGYYDLYLTDDANTTVQLYSAPEGFTISGERWVSDALGADAFVSWYEVADGGAGMTDGVLVRAPVISGDAGEIVGLDLSSTEYVYGTSWDYDWSPDGTAIVYRNDKELWIYDTLADQHAMLPTTILFQPRWSPDGARIAYGARAESWTTIETIHLDDLSITVVAKARNHGVNGKYVDRPSWSPDGQFILYRHLDASGFDWYYDIMRCTHDGKSPTNLTGDVTMSFYGHGLTIVGWRLE
jgi:hypothetical protein